MNRTLTATALGLALVGCSGARETAPAPTPEVDRYAVYAELVDREERLLEPPKIPRMEADELATRVCASTTESFRMNLTSTSAVSDDFDPLGSAILDRRMFVIAYCDERLPDFDQAATQACAEAVDVVGRNCPGKFSTL